MPNTDEYWDIDGTSLHEYAWSIQSLTGRTRAPSKRGSNPQTPYRDGAIWVPKTAEPQVLSLGMWVIGTDENGIVDPDRRALFNDNWRALARLFWTDTEMHTVTKRWRSIVDGDVVLKTASALCEVTEGIDVTIDGPQRGVFTVDLTLPDVFFFGAEEETEIPLDTPTVITNPGDVTSRWMQVRFEGGLVNPVLTNSTFDPEIWVQYGGTIADDDQVALDTKLFTAHHSAVLTPETYTNVIGGISRSGSRYWMALAPGDNTLTLTAGSGDGKAFVAFQPPYF